MVARGEVWWVELGSPRGSQPAERRPVLIVSDDRFNSSLINTVSVVAIVSNERLGAMPGNVALDTGTAGLDRPSVINVSQVVTVDKGKLIRPSGKLGRDDLLRVDDGLRLVLSL